MQKYPNSVFSNVSPISNSCFCKNCEVVNIDKSNLEKTLTRVNEYTEKVINVNLQFRIEITSMCVGWLVQFPGVKRSFKRDKRCMINLNDIVSFDLQN